MVLGDLRLHIHTAAKMCGKFNFTTVLLVVAFCGFGNSSLVFNFTCDLSPEKHDQVLQEAITKLRRDNFTVEEGVMKFSTSTRFYANPSTPYGLYTFDTELPMWKLSETDAIVFFGCTPPPAKYFSFRSYIFARFNNLRPTILFASLGDSTNNLVINTTGLTTASDPFGKTTVVTTTADVNTDNAIREAFVAAGVPATAMNTDIVPSSLVKMGQEKLADSFSMLVRVAVSQNHTQGQDYLNTTWPIIRVSPPPQQTPLPFLTPELRKRGSGNSESTYNDSLTSFVNLVDKTIKKDVNFSVTFDRMGPVHLEGRECIEMMKNCLGDNRDAAYMNSSRFYELKENDLSFFVVCGLNHVKTGKATYINFAVSSVISVDDSQFGESARQYAPNMPDVDMFYAYKVARKCGGEDYCLEVPLNKIGADKEFNFVARAYLEPSTKVGPDTSELLMPYVLRYTPN